MVRVVDVDGTRGFTRFLRARQRISRMMSKISIGKRIGLLVLSALVTLSLLASAVAIGERQLFQATNDLKAFRSLFEQTARIERQASQMRFEALRFATDRDAAAADAFRLAAAEIAGGLADIRQMPAATTGPPAAVEPTGGPAAETGVDGTGQPITEIQAQIDRLSAGMDSLRTKFDAVVALAEQIGFDDTAGLRGKLRASSDAVEAELVLWPNIDPLLLQMQAMRRYEKDFIIYQDDSFLRPHRKAYNQFRFQLSDVGLDPQTQEKLNGLIRAYRSDLRDFERTTEAFAETLADFTLAFQEMGPSFDTLLQSAQLGMSTADGRQIEVRDQVIDTSLVTGSALILLFVVIGLLVARSITRPLKLIETVMQRLAGGEMQDAVPGTQRGDEIGSMARAVQFFKENIERTAQLEATARENESRSQAERRNALLAVANDFDTAFGKVLVTVGDATRQIREGALVLRDTAETMRTQAVETSEKSQKTSEVVGIANSVSQTLSTSIGDTGNRVASSGTAVQRAAERARQSDRTVQALSDSSQRIGEIVKLINAIAGQTNLLALNATIEAARAGESGRGFAVVASEVKNLAAQTAKATDEIGDLVVSIQSATADVVDAMRSIRANIEEVESLSSDVSQAVDRQLEQTQEIVHAVDDASANSLEVSDSVSNMARTAAETGRSAVEMILSAQRLGEEFDQLQADANRFVQSIRA